ncbi:uncharacterized protein PHACADRAFT_201738 [Phanerochaete carnosa HHB-10118-sp]|uniref:DUF6589 domain-containing protein n=1 Tax=Phanerochaete carnosa (strain HHB-10118-sp) TaxID=650164 RepID=K5WGZ7_PHACS|nr:uncharacterized protein PHACADRAFT_201738 [Phanerochaete carnosa HHB-10118-sp]EKM49482.1 hypothetical protein PHACADRAFT_201738 [Phanerochaete carnosa HHB-10118-sp]
MSAIYSAIKLLSDDAMIHLWKLGRRWLVAYCYDNFDVMLKSVKWTQEASRVPLLKHLTSGLFISLPPGTVKADLWCSKYLWQQSCINDTLPDDHPGLALKPEFMRMLELYPQNWEHDQAGMNEMDRWNKWKFASDLILYGPQYFCQFALSLEPPETFDAIPLSKTECTPAKAMNIPNFTVARNIKTIVNLLKQRGIYSEDSAPHRPQTQQTSSSDASDDKDDDDKMKRPKPIDNYIVLFHGDLGTGKRIAQALKHCAIEKSPWDWLQFVIYIFSLFHLKMAYANAIWHMFIQPLLARLNLMSVMHHVTILQEKETGIIGKDPGFWRMHQIITHNRRCRHLNCWQTEIHKCEGHETLENTGERIDTLQSMPERDEQFENGLVINKYYLLYEQLTYAMNVSNTESVEACLVPWTLIFKAVRKHKYAAEMIKHMTNVHFIYPPGLKRVV